jgi:hypothetical protein
LNFYKNIEDFHHTQYKTLMLHNLKQTIQLLYPIIIKNEENYEVKEDLKEELKSLLESDKIKKSFKIEPIYRFFLEDITFNKYLNEYISNNYINEGISKTIQFLNNKNYLNEKIQLEDILRIYNYNSAIYKTDKFKVLSKEFIIEDLSGNMYLNF